MKEEYRELEYNLTTTDVELVNVSASWDEVQQDHNDNNNIKIIIIMLFCIIFTGAST